MTARHRHGIATASPGHTDAGPQESAALNREYVRQHRVRRREGLAVFRVVGSADGVAAWLVGHGWLAQEDSRNRKKIEAALRSEEHTSELQSLMRISYAVLCL